MCGDPALRLPDPGAGTGSRPRAARRAPGAALRRGADRHARGARATRRRRPPRARSSLAAGSAGRRSRATARCATEGLAGVRRQVRPRDRRLPGHREGDRAAVRRARSGRASRSATCGQDRAAEATAGELRGRGAEPILLRGNIGDAERVAELLAQAGPLDVIVANAATGVIRPTLELEEKHWDWTINANARSVFTLARHAAPSMPPGSSIVAVSSLGSVRVLDDYVLVGVSKAAIETLVRYLAVELAPRGIRVNAVSAGLVETGALDHFPEPRADARLPSRADAGRTARRAAGDRRRRLLPRLARRGDDSRPHARRRRRLFAARVSSGPDEIRPLHGLTGRSGTGPYMSPQGRRRAGRGPAPTCHPRGRRGRSRSRPTAHVPKTSRRSSRYTFIT